MPLYVVRCLGKYGMAKKDIEECPVLANRIYAGSASEAVIEHGPTHFFGMPHRGHIHCIGCKKIKYQEDLGELLR